MMKLKQLSLLLFLGLCISCQTAKTVQDQTSTIPEVLEGVVDIPTLFNLSDTLPNDPAIRIGKLDNGLTYYIRNNEKPQERAELRLIINAGSILENEKQLGLAHFVEHMAFNGTKNFAKNEIVDYLQTIGVEFGADLNAYTSFDETVYILPIPTDDQAIIDQSFQILEDWAHQITFDPEEIDKERGVVLEEWRLGQGADQRMRDKWFPVMFKGSRYAERLPIGTKDNLENFKHQDLVDFYKTWYRPDLMAVAVVGDLDPDAVEAKIKAHFSKLQSPEQPAPREEFSVPSHLPTYVAIEQDPEATFNQIQMFYKKKSGDNKTFASLRQGIVNGAYNQMLGSRLSELVRESVDPPFIFGSSSFGGSFVRDMSAYTSFAVAPGNKIKDALQVLIEENERVKRHGFLQSELDRVKAVMKNGFERAYKERDKQESGNYISEMVNNFLKGEPMSDIETILPVLNQYVDEIGLEEVNALPAKWITNNNRVIVITASDKSDVDLPTKDEVLQSLRSIKGKEIAPYSDGTAGTVLMVESPTPGTIASKEKVGAMNITQYTLSNGATVFVKPTEFKNDEILFSASSDGGTSVVPDSDFKKVRMASAIVSQSGVGDFSLTQLQKLLAGKTVRVSPSIGGLSEGFSGSAAPKDLETMFQLLNLYFTAPRKDSIAFTSMINQQKGFLKNILANPQFYYQMKLNGILTKDHPRAVFLPEEEEWDMIDLDAVMDHYQDRFSDAGNFTYFLVGNIDEAQLEQLLETYLAGIPSVTREDQWKDIGVRPPAGGISEKFYKGTDEKSMVSLIWTGESEYSMMQNFVLTQMADILDIRLTEVLREELGGVYGSNSSARASKKPYESVTVNVSFPCAPENVDQLITAALGEIEQLQKEGPSEEDLLKVKEQILRSHEERLEQNDYWLSFMSSYHGQGRAFDDVLEFENRVKSVTGEQIQDAAKAFIKKEALIQAVLYPEEQ